MNRFPARSATAIVLLLLVTASVASAEEPEWFLAIKAAYARPVKTPKDQPPLPPVAARFPGVEFGYREERFGWNGVAIVWDDVRLEALFLGGHNGGMPFGTPGSWALSEGGKWRRLESGSPVFDSLREEVVEVRTPVKRVEAELRNRFYSFTKFATDHQRTLEQRPSLQKAGDQTARIVETLSSTRAPAGIRPLILEARLRIERALERIETARQSLPGMGLQPLEAAAITACFDAQWLLDEAADCLASSPPPREGAAAILDPATKCVVLFGGSHHDYMTNDTWLYDPAKQSWRQLWPKVAPTARMNAKFTRAADGKLVLSGGETVLNKMVYQKGEMPAPAGEWTFDPATGEWSGEGGAPPGTRIYRSTVPGYDPRWYDAAPRGDAAATEKWLAELKPNLWTAVPEQPAPAPERDWGTAVFDPDRDQIYRWTGGHCADPSTNMSTYHPGLNRWSIPYIPDIITARKGMTFSGRPDCANHTYLHYAYDPLARRLICLSQGGTGVFNPDLGDFEFSVDQPFNRQIYETCTVGTPRGVIAWTQGGKFWLFDHAARAWNAFPVTGKPPRPTCDGSAICYDAKRDCVWMASFVEYQKPSGNLWRLDLKTGAIEALNPAGGETIGRAKGFNSEIRESVYVPTLDLVLFNNFVAGKQVAYDPTGNRWVRLSIPKNLERLGTVSDTLTWDPKRKLVWNLNSYKAIYVLKLDGKTLEMTDKLEP